LGRKDSCTQGRRDRRRSGDDSWGRRSSDDSWGRRSSKDSLDRDSWDRVSWDRDGWGRRWRKYDLLLSELSSIHSKIVLLVSYTATFLIPQHALVLGRFTFQAQALVLLGLGGKR